MSGAVGLRRIEERGQGSAGGVPRRFRVTFRGTSSFVEDFVCVRACVCASRPQGLYPYQYEPAVCHRARFAHISTVDKVVLFHINTSPEFVIEQGVLFFCGTGQGNWDFSAGWQKQWSQWERRRVPPRNTGTLRGTISIDDGVFSVFLWRAATMLFCFLS